MKFFVPIVPGLVFFALNAIRMSLLTAASRLGSNSGQHGFSGEIDEFEKANKQHDLFYRHRKLQEIGLVPLDKFIADSYVVVLDDDVVNVAAKASTLMDMTMNGDDHDIACVMKHVFNATFKGFAIDNVSMELLEYILADPEVVHVTRNKRLSYTSLQTDVFGNWGLDRIDQPSLPLDGLYHTHYSGAGVSIYLVDSGFWSTHIEFSGGRIVCGADFVNDPVDRPPCDDYDGHGTAMAGIAGGNYVGVAKGAKLVSVKIGNRGEPLVSTILAGLEFVLNQKLMNTSEPMVTSLSFGGYFEFIIDQAVERMVDAGIVVVAAAGNEQMDACYASPARVPKAITVGATYADDTLWEYSNYGPCVDIYAPGGYINHPWRKIDDRYVNASGSSQATPFVSAVAAMHLERNNSLTPAEVLAEIKKYSVIGLIRPPENETDDFFEWTNSTNLLLNIGEELAYGPQPTSAPTARPTTASPVSLAPVTTAPATAAPVTASPVTNAPVTTAPIATLSPVSSVPIAAPKYSNQYISGFQFAETGKGVLYPEPIAPGSTYSYGTIAGGSTLISIQANTTGTPAGTTIKSMKFTWANEKGPRRISNIERTKPFLMGGNIKTNYFPVPYLGSPGNKTVFIEGYNRTGSVITSMIVSFQLIK